MTTEWSDNAAGMDRRILRNAVRCRHCFAVIESTHNHDFRTCPCGKVSVDGGRFYLRRVCSGEAQDAFEELSEMEP